MKHKLVSILLVVMVAVSLWGVLPTSAAPMATCTWTGSTSTAWETTGNWSGCTVPANNDTVIIPSATNNPVISTAATTGLNVTIQNGGKLTNSSSGTIAFTTFTINNGGTYIHNRAAAMPGTTKTFGPSSTIELQQYTNACPPTATYGNLIINVSNYTQSNGCSGNFNAVAGNLEIKNTSGFELRLVNTQSTAHNIGGNLIISGGTLVLSSGTGAPAVTVSGNVSITAGTLNLGNSSGAPTLNIGGNFNQTGGTFTASGSGFPTTAFTGGSSLVTFSQSGGTLTNTRINWQIASSKTVALNNNLPVATGRTLTVNGTLNTGASVVSGAGTFAMAASGATLGIGDANGITTAACGTGATCGSIRTTNRTFQPNATYNYNGTTAQVTGNGLPSNASTALQINNAAGVTLSGAQMVGTLTVASGRLTLGAYDLTLSSSAPAVAGSPFSASNMIVAEGTGSLCKQYNATGSYDFPIGDNTATAEYSPATLNFTAGTFGSGAQACVRVVDAFQPNGDQANYPTYITRYWPTTQSGISGFNCTATFNYVPADVVIGSGQSAAALYHWSYSGGVWTRHNQVTVANTLSSDVSSFSDQTARSGSPLAVTIASFGVDQVDDHNTLTWETASELHNLGFNVWRSASAVGPLEKLNDYVIPSQGMGGTDGFVYTYVDLDAVNGIAYTYWLDDVDLSGSSTRHGPVSVAASAVPNAVRLTSLSAQAPAATSTWPLLGVGLLALVLSGAALLWRSRIQR